MAPPTLHDLITDVERATATDDPLQRLATASMTAADLGELSDAMLSHFVDRCRAAGCSWSEIGGALGVTKQAVQKRFTGRAAEPVGWDRFTPRTKQVVLQHAPGAAAELGHGWIGTEHLLLGFWGEPECIATKALEELGLRRPQVKDAVEARVQHGAHLDPNFTPRAWSAVNAGSQRAVELGHNYVGTEHLLLALVSGVGGMADEILAAAGITRTDVQPVVIRMLTEIVRQRSS